MLYYLNMPYPCITAFRTKKINTSQAVLALEGCEMFEQQKELFHKLVMSQAIIRGGYVL